MISLKTWSAGAARPIVRLLLAACAAAGGTGAAYAQEPPAVISPLRVETDHNGVNLVSGKTVIEVPVLSVPGAPRLRFDRVQNAAPYVTGKVHSVGTDSYRISSYSVHTGAGTEAFKCTDYDCTSVTGSGSTFIENSNIFRQAGTGAVWNFTLKHVKETTPQPAMQYYASNVTYPGGETISYSYQSYVDPPMPNRTYYRPTTISSSFGFHISIAYQSDVFGTNEWGQVREATLYATAAPTTPLRRFVYASNGQVITEYGGTDPVGRTFNCQGCINQLGVDLEVGSGSTQLPGGGAATQQAVAHANHPVVAAVVKDGVTWIYTYVNLRYDVTSRGYWFDKLTVTGPNGYNTAYDMTISERRNVMTKSTDSIGRATNYLFDSAYRPTQIVLPEGNMVNVSYDERGNIDWKRTRAKPGSGLADLVETAFFDTMNCTGVMCYRPLWARDGLNRQTDFAYNGAGQVTEQTDPADASGVRRKTYTQYDAYGRKTVVRVCGHVTTCGTANEIRTEYDYWGATFLPSVERKIDAARGETLTTAYGYDSAGRLLYTDGPLPGSSDATYNRYDKYGRKSWEIGALGVNGRRNAKRFTYRDSDDKLLYTETGTLPDANSFVLAPLTRTDIAYDSRRNPIREAVSDASGIVQGLVQKSFDDRGQLECEARRMNPAAFASSPASACTLGVQGTGVNDFGPDRITRNTYDAAGQQLKVQKAYGITTANGYPVTLQQDYARYEYTLNGKQKAVIDANNNRAELTWDGHDRQKRWIFPSPTAVGSANQADYEEYGYDLVGNRTSLRKRDGVTLSFVFDARNRMTLKSVPQSASGAPGYAVHYGYDAEGQQTYARFGSANGLGVTNTYDGFGRLTSSVNSTGGVSRTVSYQYDSGNRRSRLYYPDGNFISYDHDAAARLTAISENGAVAIAGFSYDSAGRPTGTGFTGAGTSYSYDTISRLAGIGHDLSGTANDQSLTFGYNPASQITKRERWNAAYASNTAYNVSRPYGVNGLNQYTSAGPATFLYDANGNLRSDGSTSYVYDAENRLVVAAGAQNVSLAYDPMGHLFQTSGGSAGTTRFLYDGDELIAEYDGAGNMLRRYVHGTQTDDPVVWYEGAGLGTRRGLLADHQGSIVAVADSSGNKEAINAYDSWGIPNAANLGRFQYTGQAWLPELGMYYYKARIYSPTLGRFLQTDPVGYEDDVNLYAYVKNDPANAMDPFGESCVPQDNGSSICDPPGDDIGRFTIPANDNPGYIGPNEGGHHVYNAETSTPYSSEGLTSSITQSVVNNPTPGNDQPATPGGTRNDAGISPGWGRLGDAVNSFVTTDSNGNTVVVNVTIPGEHMLNPGYVAQAIIPGENSTRIVVVGEGNAYVQVGPGAALGGLVFQRKIEGDMRRGIFNAVRSGRW